VTKPTSSYYLTYKPNGNFADAVMVGDYIYATGSGTNLGSVTERSVFYRYKAEFTVQSLFKDAMRVQNTLYNEVLHLGDPTY